jgi:hypothetical protein
MMHKTVQARLDLAKTPQRQTPPPNGFSQPDALGNEGRRSFQNLKSCYATNQFLTSSSSKTHQVCEKVPIGIYQEFFGE